MRAVPAGIPPNQRDTADRGPRHVERGHRSWCCVMRAYVLRQTDARHVIACVVIAHASLPMRRLPLGP